MGREEHNNRVDYVEIPATDIARSKRFYAEAFGWKYQDWGDAYADTSDGRLSHGLNAVADGRPMHPLVIIYATNVEDAKRRVVAAGGTITRDIFSFPGGRRFHFRDPGGNELAVWTQDSE